VKRLLSNPAVIAAAAGAHEAEEQIAD